MLLKTYLTYLAEVLYFIALYNFQVFHFISVHVRSASRLHTANETDPPSSITARPTRQLWQRNHVTYARGMHTSISLMQFILLNIFNIEILLSTEHLGSVSQIELGFLHLSKGPSMGKNVSPHSLVLTAVLYRSGLQCSARTCALELCKMQTCCFAPI